MNQGMDDEQFTVQGMTGVDLSLQIAGPGSRSYAFIIDWHIRLILAVAWFVIGMLIVSGGLRFAPDAPKWAVLLVTLPSGIIYLFYHPILELLMHGQTPGKRMAGVRVVNREGGPPSAGAIVIRNCFRLIDSLPMFYVVGLVTTFITEQRIRIGDMAAGTLLVMNDTAAAKSLDRLAALGNAHGIDPNALDLVEQLLERWKQMSVDKRIDIARSLLQRIDPKPSRPPAQMSEEELRARLIALTGSGESR